VVGGEWDSLTKEPYNTPEICGRQFYPIRREGSEWKGGRTAGKDRRLENYVRRPPRPKGQIAKGRIYRVRREVKTVDGSEKGTSSVSFFSRIEETNICFLTAYPVRRKGKAAKRTWTSKGHIQI